MKPWLRAVGVLALAVAGVCWALVLSGRAGAPAVTVDPPAASVRAGEGGVRWLKGQLHAHSSGSGDSQTPAAEVVGWYAARGYDFVVLTDHNHVSSAPSRDGTLAGRGVELTWNSRRCTPASAPGMGCLLHVNALFLGEDAAAQAAAARWPPDGAGRLEVYAGSVALARRMGGVAQLNHPNFHHGADAALIARLAEEGPLLLEIANQAVDSNNDGGGRRPSTEALWDAVLTRGARVWATATDDAHHYQDAETVRARGEVAHVGDLGFVMVRSKPDPDRIRTALMEGRFYASTGPRLLRVEVAEGALVIESEVEASIVFVGEGGRELSRSFGRVASFSLPDPGGSGYVRAVVRDAEGRSAWTQPLFAPR